VRETAYREADRRKLDKSSRLAGFIEMWEMKRRDVFMRLARKLRPSLLVK
jgi:hypothetical protein